MSTADGKYGIPTRFGKMVKAATGRGADGAAGIGAASASPTPWADDLFVLVADGSQSVTLTFLPLAKSTDVKLNGVGLEREIDYSVEGSTVNLLAPAGDDGDPLTGDKLTVHYQYTADDPTDGGVEGGEYAAQVLADGPELYWRLGGDTYLDSSGNGHTGYSPAGVATIFPVAGLVPGDSDGAVDFAGQTIVQHDYAAWMDTTAFTVEAIIQTGAVSASHLVIVERDAFGFGQREWSFKMRPDGALEGQLFGSAPITLSGVTAVNDAARHHVALAYDGGTLRLLVDGAVDASTPSATVLGAQTPPLLVGGDEGPGPPPVSQLWEDVIDEVAFYKTALSPARIAAHAAAAGLA